MPVKDGPSCPGCGLANYEGLCPHCRGDAEAYEAELVPPFDSIETPADDYLAWHDTPRWRRRRREERDRLADPPDQEASDG